MSVEITRLDNGIHVVTDSMPHLETTALGIWVRAGARDESKASNGVAHLLEHMAFKGTPRRSARQIAEEIETAGGEINASTAMETTTYYARVLKEDWPLALDILSDILIEPMFDEAELRREKNVILQEIAAAHDTPDDLVFDLAQEAAFGDVAVGRSILGTPETLMAHSAGTIAEYRDTNYGAGRMTISAAGNIDHAQFADQVDRHLGTRPAGQPANWQAPEFTGGLKTAGKPIDQTHLVLSFPGLSYLDEDIYAMQLLASILGGGMSSRLFQEVRELRGLCYSVFSFASAFCDTGLLSVYAATAPGKVDELNEVISDVTLSVCEGVTEEELQRAKAQIKSALVMNLESASGRADQIARQLQVFGEVPDMSRMLQKIDRVDSETLCSLANRTFRGGRLAVGATGDLSQLASYDKMVSRFGAQTVST